MRAPLRLGKRRQWERTWRNLDDVPGWLEDGPRAQVCAARESGWLPPGASVLDVGCGIGGSAGWLASLGHRVHGIDVSSAAITEARRRHRGVTGLTFKRGDVSRPIKARGPYDVVLDLGCLHQLPSRMHEGYAANIRRLTAPGSRCLYLVRVWERKGHDSPDVIVRMVQDVLGPEFVLELAQPTEMQATHVEEVRPGVELRFLRG